MSPSPEKRTSLLMEAFFFVELTFFTIVREIRTESGNAALGILSAIARVLMMVTIFFVMYEVIGLRGSIIRGDTILFLVTGVLLFFMHNNAVQRTVTAGSVVSPMMQHAPMTPTLMIVSSALAGLYLHVLAMGVILTGLYIFKGELDIYDPGGLILPFFLAWASGVVVGLLFLLIKPFAPKAMRMVSTIYQRANLITSGKFFVANLLPNAILPYFAWNPLFHSIDQSRGAAFVNYYPHKTTIEYPLAFVCVGLVIGLMGEFWLRKTVSRSTAATH
ncbi:MAG: ABC transporter permease [Rhodobacteraceae bacterium]|nr:ABC transporter permease [Paracoccaceae bacterium]